MTKTEALEILERLHYCTTHGIKMSQWAISGEYKCVLCEEAEAANAWRYLHPGTELPVMQ